jgi:Extensin-like protein C-terminus
MTRKVQNSFRKQNHFESMARSVRPFVLLGGVALLLSGCGFLQRAERPAWRAQAEKVCLSEGRVKRSAYVQELSAIDGPGLCGLEHPLRVSALKDGAIPLDKTLTVDCPMVAAIEDWLDQTVQPAAMARFGVAVSELDVFGAYSCRTVDNLAGEKLSEHAFGNAVDVSGFVLADGRRIVIVRDWKKTDTQESAFLHEAHAGACGFFTTVLGPGSDAFHYNHFHLDLAMHGRTNTGPRRYCRPNPAPNLMPPPGQPDGLPPAPDVDEPQDVARAKPRVTPSYAAGPVDLHGPNVAIPAPVGTEETQLVSPTLPAQDDADMTATSPGAAPSDE